jgi:hypothetical protein
MSWNSAWSDFVDYFVNHFCGVYLFTEESLTVINFRLAHYIDSFLCSGLAHTAFVRDMYVCGMARTSVYPYCHGLEA